MNSGSSGIENQGDPKVSCGRNENICKTQTQDVGGKRPPAIKTTVSVVSGQMELFKNTTLNTPSTPRIELSRASSSSHHDDSRDSSPENVFEQVGTGTLQETIGLGFREEGALELRSSTEELFFMDPDAKKEEQEKIQQQQLQQARRSSPLVFKFDEHQCYLQQHQRKDSASSEVAALLCISGRTSRVSSVGSQGSAVSRLSAISGVSRSPSPHRMLLETSFCGPKPLENVVDGRTFSTTEAPTAEILEQVLLSRKQDPTQAVLAEGIKIESSPQKKKPPVSIDIGQTRRKSSLEINKHGQSASKPAATKLNRLTQNKSPGQLVMGTTPSGSEYIRINLKPDHMYKDKGVAPNERVVDISEAKTTKQKKPISLSLGKNITINEKRLTPNSSPKLSRHSALAKEFVESRSPSPANVSVSRKNSFCSLFKHKDSPDSPKDHGQPRSKSRDRFTPQSQNPTPNKQKSVLAIFKPKRSENKSKSSSPVDHDFGRNTPLSKTETPMETYSATGSRPSSRLRYYDTPTDNKGIYIPLHTPPEEKEARKLVEALQERPQSAPNRVPLSPAINSSESKPDLHKAPIQTSDQPVEQQVSSKEPVSTSVKNPLTIENLDAIHMLPQDSDDKECTWSLEVHHHSSQDSQDTILSENSLPKNSTTKISARANLENLTESPIRENGIAAEVHRAPVESVASTTQPVEDATSKERRRILFATRIGSGSQEQIFSTQLSLSKTESLSSQLSEQASIPESPAQEHLHRKDTILRRPDDITSAQKTVVKVNRNDEMLKKLRSEDEAIATVSKSRSTSEDEKQFALKSGVVMRKKEVMKEDLRQKSSRSESEEEDLATLRHSRYLENFDYRKKFHENVTKRKSTSPIVLEKEDVRKEDTKQSQEKIAIVENIPEQTIPPLKTQSPISSKKINNHHKLPSDRQSIGSLDEPASSESERDSQSDPNHLKRHLNRHIVSAIEDHESAGLVSQESFDDELPYIPTTLPEERAHGVALIPMKERAHMDIKTCSLDRPRSITPLNPSHLEEYCGAVTAENGESDYRTPVRGEKLRISLPRKDSKKEKAQKSKSPRRTSTSSGKSWFEFAEEAIRGGAPGETTKNPGISKNSDENQAQLETQQVMLNNNNRKSSDQWIDFENIPEKRKTPKKITILPKDTLSDNKTMDVVVHYNYVKPEECQCECHEVERESALIHKKIISMDLLHQPGEDMEPLLEPEALDNMCVREPSRDCSGSTDDENEASGQALNEEFPLRAIKNPRTKEYPDSRHS